MLVTCVRPSCKRWTTDHCTCGASDAVRLWWSFLLPAMAHQPIRALTVSGAAVSALASAQIGAVALRSLELFSVDFADRGHGRGATSVVACHKRSLENLQVRVGVPSLAPVLDVDSVEVWSITSLLGDVGILPALKALDLTCHLDRTVAAAVAAACPALECLAVQPDQETLDGDLWECWTLPEALPRLSSLHCRRLP